MEVDSVHRTVVGAISARCSERMALPVNTSAVSGRGRRASVAHLLHRVQARSGTVVPPSFPCESPDGMVVFALAELAVSSRRTEYKERWLACKARGKGAAPQSYRPSLALLPSQ